MDSSIPETESSFFSIYSYIVIAVAFVAVYISQYGTLELAYNMKLGIENTGIVIGKIRDWFNNYMTATYCNAPLKDSLPVIKQHIKKMKKGFCYIGEDNKGRKCISVDNSNDCMSGKIFPSLNLCINPSVR